jgi:hypothetical protein
MARRRRPEKVKTTTPANAVITSKRKEVIAATRKVLPELALDLGTVTTSAVVIAPTKPAVP